MSHQLLFGPDLTQRVFVSSLDFAVLLNTFPCQRVPIISPNFIPHSEQWGGPVTKLCHSAYPSLSSPICSFFLTKLWKMAKAVFTISLFVQFLSFLYHLRSQIMRKAPKA